MEYNINDEKFVSTYDNCPFWSAHFGYTLLNAVDYKEGTVALDIGTGTGFPAIELAERLGNSSVVFALDLWESALKRAEFKSRMLGVENVKFINASACEIPFEDNNFDLIVSNNCFNNILDSSVAFSECYRVLKKDGQLIQVFNLPDSMKEFYDLYSQLLLEKGMTNEIAELSKHINRLRKNIEQMEDVTVKAGFTIINKTENSFTWPFVNGTSMFNYSFVKLAFLPEWRAIIQDNQKCAFFKELEEIINDYSVRNKGFRLTIPYACIVAKK